MKKTIRKNEVPMNQVMQRKKIKTRKWSTKTMVSKIMNKAMKKWTKSNSKQSKHPTLKLWENNQQLRKNHLSLSQMKQYWNKK